MLRGFGGFDESGLSEVLTDNLVYYLDYGFVEKGGYTNVERGSDLANYTKQHKLYPIDDDLKIWVSRRKNWVWENNRGLPISGVYIDGDLSTSGYTVNYKNGYIEFDQPVSGTVELNYSYKYIQVFDADENRIFSADQDSFNVTDSVFINGSGFSLPDRRIQLPAIGVEVLTGRTMKPYELGNYSQDTNTHVLCNIFTTNDKEAKRIADYLSYQKDRVFNLFDRDHVASGNLYPLNYDGTLNNPSGTYPYLSENFPFKKAFAGKASILDLEVEEVNEITPRLFHTTVRFNLNCVY